MQPDSQGLHLRYPRYGEDPDTDRLAQQCCMMNRPLDYNSVMQTQKKAKIRF